MAERSTTTLDAAGALVISRPKEAGSDTIQVPAGQPISFDFDLDDATVTQSGGDIVLAFADGAEITLVSGAGGGGFGGTLFQFSDGIVVTESALVSSPGSAGEASGTGQAQDAQTSSQAVDKPDAGESVEVTVQAGQPISFAFDVETAEVIRNDNDIVILFADGGQITLVSVLAGVAAEAPPLVLLNDGSLVTPQEILDLSGGGDALASGLSDVAPASGSPAAPDVSPLPTPPPEVDGPEIDTTPLAGPPDLEPAPPPPAAAPTVVEPVAPPPEVEPPAPPPPPPEPPPPLFTENTDTVDFNQLVQGSFADGTAYNALGGDDNVILFDSADAAAEVGFNTAVTFDAGAGDDTITGAGLDDIIFGGAGEDTITGGGGADTVDTGSGDDVGVFAADPGGGSSFDGGDGTDMLVVNLTADNLQNPAMVQELTALCDFIQSESTEPATFEQIGITVANWEDVTILLDGEPVDLDAALPSLTVEAASGDEDTAIVLDIDAELTDTDGSEVLSVTISDIPDGALLSAGNVNEDGSVTLTPDQLSGLTITPVADSSDDFTLAITATTQEQSTGDTASVTASLDVNVAPVADTPTLATAAASGDEDTAIALDIGAALTDTDGSETLEVTITGIPDGATLSAGTLNLDGSVTLTPDQLDGLTILSPADSDADFTLSVTATSTDGTDTASTTASLAVTVAAVADTPTLTAASASGDEDTAIALEIAATLPDEDGSEVLSVTISGIPDGASLSAGTVNPDGSVTLTPDQLAGLTITPPEDSDVDSTLEVTATVIDGDDTATTTASLDVTVAAVADTPILTVEPASGGGAGHDDNHGDDDDREDDGHDRDRGRGHGYGHDDDGNDDGDGHDDDEDSEISLQITAALTDLDGSESLSINISGIPDGAVLSAGTVNPDGSVTLTPDQLAGLTVTPPEDSTEDFTLIVTATSTDGDDTASTTALLPVTVDGDDAPTLTVEPASGDEDAAIALDISATLTDGSEVLTVTISEIPDGAVLSAGTLNPNGSVTLTPDQLSGLTITPPADSDVDFTLNVTATDGDDETTAPLEVTVAAVADAPTLTVEPASGGEETYGDGDDHHDDDGNDDDDGHDSDEDSSIPLQITAALTDLDGSETLSITITGIPAGAVLSAGILNLDGSVTLTPDQLAGLTVTPPEDSTDDFTLIVTATSTDGSDTASTTALLPGT